MGPKKDKQNFEGRTKYPPPSQIDNAERQIQPMQEQIQPGLDVSSDKDFLLLESAKSIEETKNAKRTRDEGSPTEIRTHCCFKKLNRNRNTELCVCGATFFKCKCGLWKAKPTWMKKQDSCVKSVTQKFSNAHHLVVLPTE